MAKETYLPPTELIAALSRARQEALVVAGIFTSEHCPFCVALKKEQLTPRMRSAAKPELLVIEFDSDRNQLFSTPGGSRQTASDWVKKRGMKVMPTLFMLDQRAEIIGKPIVGYALRDFYGAYLEDQIKAADALWTELRKKSG